MRGYVFALVAVGLLYAAPASAQVTYPGSVYTSNGTLTPVEKGNIISLSHVEQGISYRGVEAFGAFTGQVDSKGYDWNRRTQAGIGARFTQSISAGMVRAGVSYVQERRYAGVNRTTNGIVVSVDAWFGWKNLGRN